MTPVSVTAICAFKGGVGKTTVTANVAAAWALRGDGAVIDLDPQGNLTRAFGIQDADRGTGTAAGVLGEALKDSKRRIRLEEWSVARVHGDREVLVLEAGSAQDLSDVQDLLVTTRGGETALARLLADVRGDLDWILIDTPPASGRLTMNAVLAAEHVFAVVNPAYWSADGASRVSAYVEDTMEFIPPSTIVPGAVFRGAVLNRLPGGKRDVIEANLATLNAAGIHMLSTHIPERTAVQVGETVSEPVVSADPKSETAQVLRDLADEMTAMQSGAEFTPHRESKESEEGEKEGQAMSTSALKKRLAASQGDRVEELKAASTPTGRRPRTLVETELAVVSEGEPPLEPPALTVVAEAVEVLASTPAPEETPIPDGALDDAGEYEDAPEVTPQPVSAAKPARAKTKGETPTVGESTWRRFVTPPAARGTSVNTNRINIPVSEALIDRINELDYALAMDGSRWAINRNDLLGSAVQMLLEDPQRWETEYLSRRADLPPTPATLQGRITTEAFLALKKTRFTRNGKRPTGTLLSVIVETLLADG